MSRPYVASEVPSEGKIVIRSAFTTEARSWLPARRPASFVVLLDELLPIEELYLVCDVMLEIRSLSCLTYWLTPLAREAPLSATLIAIGCPIGVAGPIVTVSPGS